MELKTGSLKRMPRREEDGAAKGTREGQENFNGAQDRSVEEDAPSGEEDSAAKETREGRIEGEPSPEYTAQVMTRLSDPQKEGLTATLIGHVSGDVPLEKWLNVEADKVGTIAKKLLDKLSQQHVAGNNSG